MHNVQDKQNQSRPHLNLISIQKVRNKRQVAQQKDCFSGNDPPINKSALFHNEIEHALIKFPPLAKTH